MYIIRIVPDFKLKNDRGHVEGQWEHTGDSCAGKRVIQRNKSQILQSKVQGKSQNGQIMVS
jgi:hypothetical protein